MFATKLLNIHDKPSCFPRQILLLLTTNPLIAHDKSSYFPRRILLLLTTNLLIAHDKSACFPRQIRLFPTTNLLTAHEKVPRGRTSVAFALTNNEDIAKGNSNLIIYLWQRQIVRIIYPIFAHKTKN